MSKSSRKKKSDKIGFEVEGQFKSKNVDEGSDDDDYDPINELISSSKGNSVKGKIYSKKSKKDDSSSDDSSSEDSSSEEESPKKTRAPIQKKEQPIKKQVDAKEIQVDEKIITHTIEDISEECRRKFRKIVQIGANSGSDLKIVVAPNWSDNRYIPNGFTLMADAKSAVDPNVFDPTKFHYGTIAVNLAGAVHVDGKKVDLCSLFAQKDRIIAGLNSKLGGENAKLSPGITTISENSTYDESEWAASIQDDASSFVSISYTNERDHDGKKRNSDCWLTIRTGLTSASEDIFQLIEDNDRDAPPGNDEKRSWNKNFKDNTVFKLGNVIKRNRERLLFKVIKDCLMIDPNSIGNKSKMDAHSSTSHERIVVPDAEAITNKVYLLPDGRAAYTRGTILVHNLEKPLIFNENPLVGSSIFKGPNCSVANPYGESWKVDYKKNPTICAFPVDTGRIQSSAISKGVSLIETPNQFFDGDKSRLCAELYRARNDAFKQKESVLGRNHNWGQIELIPVITKLSSSNY
jgi:hypothetical protein